MEALGPTPFPILELPASERNELLREDLARTMPELQRLLATSSSEQEEVVEFRERYERLPPNTPLAPRSLKSLSAGHSTFQSLQERLVVLAKRYAPLLTMGRETLERLQIDPVLRERAVMTSFVAALTLYDNYLSIRTVMKDDRLRRLIHHPSRGYGKTENQVQALLDELHTPRRQKRLRQLVQAYDQFADHLQARHDPDIDFLMMAVRSNAAYRFARNAVLAQRLPTDANLWRERIMDVLNGLGKSTLGTLSEVFGNGIGLVEIRKGKLWQVPTVEEDLLSVLQPLDLLLEKTPFRLTDKFIPGHFGHVAVWVGTAAELDAIDLFDDPLFRDPQFASCEANVRAGRSVLEALRTGVQLSSLAEFLNVDDVAILRPLGLTMEEKRASLIRGFRQVGKQYDFNFEVQTIDKITCSELPYHVFPDIPWQTEQQFGQHTISPDQVAEQAFGPDAHLKLLEFYHDGRRVDPGEALARMTQLVNDEKD